MISYERMKKNYEEEHSVKCPHCGTDYTNNSEFLGDKLCTYHGEEGWQEIFNPSFCL